METLPTQFNQALGLISLKEKIQQAQEAHTEIRKLLETSEDLRELGIDTVLIGSYGRGTAIYPGKDVDVFAKLTNASTADDPTRLFEIVASVLINKHGDRAEAQARSIKVEFPDQFAVDVVPAVRSGDRWAIPTRDSELWGPSEKAWVETDPEKLGKLTTELNKSPTINGQGAYIPVVKLIRQTRNHHRGDEKPGGFYFELLTYWTFIGSVAGDSVAELFAATLRGAASQLASGADITDPALGTPYDPAPDDSELRDAAAVFAELADQAERALRLQRCPAAVLWREILGSNERGHCFPLPPGCDEHGNVIKKTRVESVGSKESGGFA